MKSHAKYVKETLCNLIRDISKHAWLYSEDPNRDFTRNRKLPFDKMLMLLVSMGGHALRDELMSHFGCTPDMASVPAFVQQRGKILPEVLEFLFHQFTDTCTKPQFYNGYRLLAVDGSDVQISADPTDPESYFPGIPGQTHYSLLHLNTLYDLLSRTYLDIMIQKRRTANEIRAMIQMVDRSPITEPVIVLADRGYESYNNLAHLERRGWKYLIRIKEAHGIISGFNVPINQEFDITAHIILTKKLTNAVKQAMKDHPGLYRSLPTTTTFDFLNLKDKLFYPMNFRIVRFRLSENTFETVITNLETETFSPEELKQLYFKRWGIETSFRELKYTVGLNQFQSRKLAHIYQEIYARLIMYNFAELIIAQVVVSQENKKYAYKVNFSAAVHICRQFLRGGTDPPDVGVLLKRYITPIRPGRQDVRKPRKIRSKGFLYRVA